MRTMKKHHTSSISATITLLLVLCVAIPAHGEAPQAGGTQLDLFLAIAYGNIPRLRELISEGVNLEQDAWRRDIFPLRYAIEMGNLEVIELLLSAGADIQRKAPLSSARGEHAYTPLHYPVIYGYGSSPVTRLFQGSSPVVRLLLAKGADINALSSNGDTPLHLAIRTYTPYSGIARQLIRRGADLTIKDRKGRTAWELLLDGDECEIYGPARVMVISAMLSKGCKFGIPVFDLAASGETEKLEELLEKDPSLVDVKGPLGSTPLCWAALMGRKDCAKLLLEKGADPEGKKRFPMGRRLSAELGGYTDPLHCAALGGQEDIAKELISKGVNPITINSALSWAATGRQGNMCKVLIDMGADVNAMDLVYAGNPLYRAIRSGSTHTVKILLEAGAKTDSKIRPKDSILFKPIEQGYVEIVKALLEKGVEANLEYDHNDTPLHTGVFLGHVAIARVLLDSGAQVNARNSNGETPLHLALSRRHYRLEMVKLLIERGADVRATSGDGSSMLKYAKQADRRDSIPLIEAALSKQEK